MLAQVPPETVTAIERYGSFGVVVVIVVVFIYRVIPQAIKAYSDLSDKFAATIESQRVLFTADLEKERKSREEMHERCEESHTEKTRALIELVSHVTNLNTDRQAQIKPASGIHSKTKRPPNPPEER